MKKLALLILLLAVWSAVALARAQRPDGRDSSATASADTTTLTTPADTTTLTAKQLHRQRVAQRNFHYNILGGPSYTPDFGAVLGGSMLMTFRMNPSDTTQQRSVIPTAIALMFKGGINLFAKPQLFFKGDRFRIFGIVAYKNTQENYYGIGYSTNRDYVRSDSTSQYRYGGVQINPEFMFRLGRSNFFAGPQLDINYDHLTKPADYLPLEASYAAAGGDEDGYDSFVVGVGFLVNYDSRDVPANAYRGLYLDVRGMAYSKLLGSDVNFYKVSLDYRQYIPVGYRRTLAWTIQSKHVFGSDIPITQYALTGTPFDLRGYYKGQYRDKSSHVLLAEYRHMFNTDRSTRIKKWIHHTGFVAWAGCGFMGPTVGKIEGVLPNFGVGLRIELQKRMNLRLDLGRNTVNNQTLFYFNMTEAF